MKCNAEPIGEFGKTYLMYSGCNWCDIAEDCMRASIGKEKKMLYAYICKGCGGSLGTDTKINRTKTKCNFCGERKFGDPVMEGWRPNKSLIAEEEEKPKLKRRRKKVEEPVSKLKRRRKPVASTTKTKIKTSQLKRRRK